jgi:hypothetical protein
MTGPARYVFAGLVGVCVFLGLVLVAMTPAWPHSWYPMECCSAQDCAPVDTVEQIPNASMANVFTILPGNVMPSTLVVTTKHGTVAVPPDFKMRDSPDSRMHACMAPKQGGGMRLLCLFMPPGI